MQSHELAEPEVKVDQYSAQKETDDRNFESMKQKDYKIKELLEDN